MDKNVFGLSENEFQFAIQHIMDDVKMVEYGDSIVFLTMKEEDNGKMSSDNLMLGEPSDLMVILTRAILEVNEGDYDRTIMMVDDFIEAHRRFDSEEGGY